MISTIQFNLRAILTVNSKCDLPSLILDPRTDIQVIFERLGSVLNVQHGRIRGEKKGRSRKLKEVGRHKSRRGAFMPVERLRFAMWHSTFVSYINFRRPAAELHHPNPDLKPTCNRTNVIFHVSKAIHPIYYFHSSFIFSFPTRDSQLRQFVAVSRTTPQIRLPPAKETLYFDNSCSWLPSFK